MTCRWFGFLPAALLAGALHPLLVVDQIDPARTQPASASGAAVAEGPYARIAIMRPLDGHTVDFEAAYTRHLAWHQQARDPWVWYGWTVN